MSISFKNHLMKIVSISIFEEMIQSLILLVQQELLKIRLRWTEADSENDYELNFDEFLAFRHPEIAARSYQYIVDDIISHMGLSFSSFQNSYFFFAIFCF